MTRINLNIKMYNFLKAYLVLALVSVSWLGVAGGRAGISGISGGRIAGTVTATTGPLAAATALSCGYSKEGKG